MIDNNKSIEEKVFIITNGNRRAGGKPRIEVDFDFLDRNDISYTLVYVLTYNQLDRNNIILYRTFKSDYTGVVLFRLTEDQLMCAHLMYSTITELDTLPEYVEMLMDNEIRELIIPTRSDPCYE